MRLILHCLTPKEHLKAFVVWLGLASSRPLAHPVPYLLETTLRLYLNTFRGEPAISGFDWHITSNHSSSHTFALVMGSVLDPDIIWASTWPWLAHPVSGLIQATYQACWKRRRRLGPLAPVGPTDRAAEELRASADNFASAQSRPIRTRFRCGSGSVLP